MDKAGEIVEKYADQIAQAVRDVAPEVWEAAVRKAVGDAYAGLVGGILTVAIAVVILQAGRWCMWKYERVGDSNDWSMGGVICYLVGAFIGGLGLWAVVGSIYDLLYRIEWNAMQAVVSLVKP